MNPTEEAGVVETSKALTKFGPAEAQEIGLPSPSALNFMFSTANMLYSSALVTKDMGLSKDQVARLQQFGVTGADLEDRDRKAVVSNMMGKMLVGRELGMDPIASLQDVDIVKSKIFIRYPQLHRLIEEKGWDLEEIERSNTRAAIKLTHKTKKPRTFEFTIEDAKMAGLTKRGGYNGDSPSQYELRPRVMLWSRVISEAYRATGGKGSIYTPEEKQEILREEIREAIASPAEPETDPYAVKMPPAKTESAAPIVESAANKTEAAAMGLASADAGSSASGSPDGQGNGDVTSSLPQTGEVGAESVKTQAAPAPKSPTVADIEKLLTPKSAKKTVEEFMRGYFKKADMRSVKGTPEYMGALRCLELNASVSKVILEADPHSIGRRCAIGRQTISDYTRSHEWTPELEALGNEIYPNHGGGPLAALLDIVKADDMPGPERQAFLWVLERVPDTAAVKFHRCALNMAALVSEWGMNGRTNPEIADAIEALPEPSEGEQGSLLTEGA